MSRTDRRSRRGVEDTFGHYIPVDRKPNWKFTCGELTGKAWIGKFSQVVEPAYPFDRRNVFLLVENRSRPVAAGDLTVWRGRYDEDGGGWDLEDFVDAADTLSNSIYEMAKVVAWTWGGADRRHWWTDAPFCFGDLCSFDRFLIDVETFAESLAVWTIVDALLKRIRRSVAVMILKAFPLEYEGKVNDANRRPFLRRTQALIRLYRYRLKVEPLPQRGLAEVGWMQRCYKDVQPDPDID
jgi:hypothetical protein